ncbi:nucleotidyltransferase domain-containing protein [Desulfonatronum parangueonense]
METLAGFPEVERAILFGFRAMGSYRKGSDIAIKGDRVSPQTIVYLSACLNEHLPLPYQFDLVDYAQIESPALKQHIDEHGVEI